MQLKASIRLVVIFGACFLSACGRRAPQVKQFNKVSIVATVYPLAEVARQVGGEYAEVTWIVENGQSLLGVQPSRDMQNRLSSADFVISGGNSEPWATSGFSDPLQAQRIIRLDLLNSAQEGSREGLLWLDPVIVKDMARELGIRLMIVRPEKEKEFRKQTDAYISQVDALMQKYQPQFALARTKQVLTLSRDFDALLVRFDLYPFSPVAASPTQLNDTDIDAIKRAERERNTHLLLVAADTPEIVARDLEIRAGVQVVRIDCLGSSAAGGHNTYLDMMRYNLDQLLEATSMR